VARADDIEHIEVAFADQAIPMHIEEVESGRGAPVAQQARLHVVQGQRPLQQGIVFEVDLSDREIVGGAPIGVHFGEEFRAQGAVVHWIVAGVLDHGAPQFWGICVLLEA
jgi:hypothetical protein